MYKKSRRNSPPGFFSRYSLYGFFRFGLRKETFAALAIVAAIVGVAWLAGPALKGLGNYNLLIFFLFGVGAMVLMGVPIAFSFGLATFGYIALTTRTPSMVVVGRMDEGMGHLILLAVPLFVFLGLLIEMTGMARAMVGFLASLLGHVRGGLSYVLILSLIHTPSPRDLSTSRMPSSA